jgi:hypothetical protein
MSKHENLKNFILELLNKNVPIYVIAVQEIWSIQSVELVQIPGFRFVYKSRNDGRGGGVGFYVKDNIQFHECNFYQFIDSQFENIIIDVTINKKKLLLCNIYRSPNVTGNISLRDLIEAYNSRLDELQQILNRHHQHTAIIFSDCNINVLKVNNSPLAAEYLDTCHTNGFMLTNMKATRVNPNSYSLIDHILINNVPNNIVSGSIVCDISDHFPIFYTCNDTNSSPNIHNELKRNFSFNNKTLFRETLRNIRWHSVINENDVNNSLEKFLDIF